MKPIYQLAFFLVLASTIISSCQKEYEHPILELNRIDPYQNDTLYADGKTELVFQAVISKDAAQSSPRKVTFQINSVEGGAFITPQPVHVNSLDGKAEATLKLGTKPGKYLVTVVIENNSSVKYTQTSTIQTYAPDALLFTIDTLLTPSPFFADSLTELVFVAKVSSQFAGSNIEFTKSDNYGGAFIESSPNQIAIDSNGFARITLKVGHTPGNYWVQAKMGAKTATVYYQLLPYQFITLQRIAPTGILYADSNTIIQFEASISPLFNSSGSKEITFSTDESAGSFINSDTVNTDVNGKAIVNFKVGTSSGNYQMSAKFSSFSASENFTLNVIPSDSLMTVNITPYGGATIYADTVSQIRVSINASSFAGQNIQLELINGAGIFNGSQQSTSIILDAAGQGVAFISVGEFAGNFEVKATNISNGRYVFSNIIYIGNAYPKGVIYLAPSPRQLTIDTSPTQNSIIDGIHLQYFRVQGKVSSGIPVEYEAYTTNNPTMNLGIFTPGLSYISNQTIKFDINIPSSLLDTLNNNQLKIVTKIDTTGSLNYKRDTLTFDIVY